MTSAPHEPRGCELKPTLPSDDAEVEALADLGDAAEITGDVLLQDAVKLVRATTAKLTSAERENEHLRKMLHVYEKMKEISGRSWAGFNIIGDRKSIDEVTRLDHRSAQLELFSAAYEDRIADLTRKLEAAAGALAPFVFGDGTMEKLLYAGMDDEEPGTITVKLKHFRRAREAAALLGTGEKL